MTFSSSVAGFAGVSVFCMTLGVPAATGLELPSQAPVPQSRDTALAGAVKHKTELPAAELACRKELQALGVSFKPMPAVGKTENGCAMPYPLEVSTLAPEMRLKPSAVINCSTARASARLFQEAGMAAAKEHFDARISAVVQASGYVCRPIGGSSRLSEHAFGNALDVAGIALSSGDQVIVREYDDPESGEARLLSDIREAACGIFTTVLGPGTNAAHADHFHFDMKKRRNSYCR